MLNQLKINHIILVSLLNYGIICGDQFMIKNVYVVNVKDKKDTGHYKNLNVLVFLITQYY